MILCSDLISCALYYSGAVGFSPPVSRVVCAVEFSVVEVILHSFLRLQHFFHLVSVTSGRQKPNAGL